MAHSPVRPLWPCADCGEPWPCPDAKARLLDELGGPGVGPCLVMAGYLVAAVDDGLPGAAGVLHDRFLGFAAGR